MYLRHGTRQLSRRLRHARRAREPGQPAVAPDRVAGDAHPRSLCASGHADLPPRRRSRDHQHDVLEGEPLRRHARRRPRRLSRRRRIVAARLPGGHLRAEALRRLPRVEVRARLFARLPLVCRPAARRRRRSRRLHAVAARRRPRGRSACPRLPPHRPDQRERGHAHRDDLQLEAPGEHPAVGDDQRQSARPLRLRPEGDRRADPPLLGPVRAGRGVQQAHGQPRRPDAAHRRRHAGPLAVPADQEGERAGHDVLRSHADDLGNRAPLGADDAGLVALGRARRCERALVHVADGRRGGPDVLRLG